ncbi:tripartite tricarboxylate transporter substrate binding protein [Alkalihalobacillus sp. MEB130]|uniref:tripartite tricarboxylate transporter substrate binding protein n=1 Tax=Alkalihalobacillus sp. MEB130 TaxID=2976704 RepID=UPI0028DDD43C|nr:tripartite tricarboxylate transporter substrate binding protein [Alkalihalobacillus sp. MEB130]MDT8862143.1 tripartite tricarboxylate transporter substrate binding protein [Alkalihalobacillus sp. MEB130]
MINLFKKKMGLFITICTLVALLAACGGDSTSSSGESTSSSDKSENKSSSYPTKTIEMVVPASAGGDTDRNARLLAQYLSDELDVSIVIQNVTGASGSVGVQELIDSNPDGYRVLFFHNNILINNILGLTENNYSDLKMAGISAIDHGNGVVVSRDAPYENAKELIEAAIENPGEINIGTSVGAFTHFQLLDIQEKTGAQFNLVDAGDFAERNAAILGGQLDVIPTQLGLVNDYLESGDMKALGVLAEERLDYFAEVPTFQELGIDSTFEKFFFMAFPQETPDEIVTTFTEAVERATNNEEYIQRARDYGMEPEYKSPQETDEIMETRHQLYTEINERNN